MKRTFWAPGRVNLIGEHTDHTGGLVLPVAIDLGVRATVIPAERISLVSDDVPVDVAADGTGRTSDWGTYVAAVAAELAELGRPPIGVEGVVQANLPRGAGLGSSAALEVAVALALCAVADFELPPLELARVCQRAELRAVGVPCGILDQAASLLARADHALFLDCGELVYRHVPLSAELRLVVIDSGEVHEHRRSGYAERLEELRSVLSLFGGRRPSDVAPDEIADVWEDPPAQRLRHVVTENARVREAVVALERGDANALAPLFAASQRSLRVDYDVSTPALDRLVDLALEEGSIAARLTGGGFGGSIVALAELDRAHALLDRVLVRADQGATGWVLQASEGAREL